jgi:hypothetical protein
MKLFPPQKDIFIEARPEAVGILSDFLFGTGRSR